MSDDNSSTSAKPPTNTTVQGPADGNDLRGHSYDVPVETLLNLLTADVTQQIDKRMREREQDWHRRIGLVMGIIALFGIGGIGWTVNMVLDSHIETKLREGTDEYNRRLRFETAYQEFVSLSLSLVDTENTRLRQSAVEGLVPILKEISQSQDLLQDRSLFSAHLVSRAGGFLTQ